MKYNLFALLTLAALCLSACNAFSHPADPLANTSWKLTVLGSENALPGTSVTLTFENGQASGNAGCNSYGGNYQVNGDQLKFEGIVSTLMACADQSVMDQESAYLGFLENAGRFELTNGQLQLYRSGGEALTFVPVR